MNTKNIQRPGPDVEARVGHRQLIRLIGIHPKDDENTEKRGTDINKMEAALD
jgi:hypothetical protein